MIRTLTFLLLALILAVTSQSMAVARGASAATGQMVLCTGAGPVAVYVDAQGQPTDTPQMCPDAALNVLVEGALPAFEAPQKLVRFVSGQFMGAKPTPMLPLPAPPSRAPPLMF